MAACRKDQSRDEVAGLPQLRHHREAVFAGQHHVQDHYVEGGRTPCQQIDGGLPGLHRDYLVAFGFEVKAQAVGQVPLVFYHQNTAHGKAGSSSTKVLPRPGPSLSAQARPPCRLATERTM